MVELCCAAQYSLNTCRTVAVVTKRAETTPSPDLAEKREAGSGKRAEHTVHGSFRQDSQFLRHERLALFSYRDQRPIRTINHHTDHPPQIRQNARCQRARRPCMWPLQLLLRASRKCARQLPLDDPPLGKRHDEDGARMNTRLTGVEYNRRTSSSATTQLS